MPHDAHSISRRPLSYWLSWALFALFGAGIVGFFWAGGFFGREPLPAAEQAPPAAARASKVDARTLVVRDIELRGRDGDGQPYVLRAARSLRREDEGGIVRFIDVEGELRRKDGKVQTLKADVALHDEKRRRLVLENDVVIDTPGRWQLQGERLVIDMDSHDVISDDPVKVLLPDGGRIEAKAMHSAQGRKVIRFTGGVKVRLHIAREEQQQAQAE